MEPEVERPALREPEAGAPRADAEPPRPVAFWPCPDCGDVAPFPYEKAGGSHVHGVACRQCGRRGAEKANPEAARVAWNETSERHAREIERRANAKRRRAAGQLRFDPTFKALVLSHYIGRHALEADGRDSQVMRTPVDGIECETNVRAFVDWLMPQWPDLETLRDPEAVVHRVLHDAGHGFHEIHGRERHGRDLGKWHRRPPVIGKAIIINQEEPK